MISHGKGFNHPKGGAVSKIAGIRRFFLPSLELKKEKELWYKKLYFGVIFREKEREESILKEMASRKDYYDILGIRRDATAEEIEKAYRRLARTYHGDPPPGNSVAEWRWREISEAYEILSNKEKRARYDRWGADTFSSEFFWRNLTEGSGWEEEESSHWDGFEDVFEDYFRAKGPVTCRPLPKGKDLAVALDIGFEEAIRGSRIEIHAVRERECSLCKGKGVDPRGFYKICQACGGAGQMQIGLSPDTFSQVCPHCSGQGRVHTDRCSHCGGSGRGEEAVSFSLEIPPGTDDGCRIYKIGMGHASHQGGPRGDLVAEIRLKPHPYFKRKGKDLLVEVPLAPWEAALGAEIEIPTLNGAERLRIPPGTATGKQARIMGKGGMKLLPSGLIFPPI